MFEEQHQAASAFENKWHAGLGQRFEQAKGKNCAFQYGRIALALLLQFADVFFGKIIFCQHGGPILSVMLVSSLMIRWIFCAALRRRA